MTNHSTQLPMCYFESDKLMLDIAAVCNNLYQEMRWYKMPLRILGIGKTRIVPQLNKLAYLLRRLSPIIEHCIPDDQLEHKKVAIRVFIGSTHLLISYSNTLRVKIK